MSIYLVRHAKAGSRSDATADDLIRPLTENGWIQAEAIAKRLAKRNPTALFSSPFTRCRQTLEPLAAAVDLEIVNDDRLAERGEAHDALELLTAVPDGAVLCSHGDVIPDTIVALQRRGCVIATEPDWRKGSVWTLDRDANGQFVRAKVWRPADPVRKSTVLRVGIAHHLGWAVAVTAAEDHAVVDRRRIELIEPGVAAAPIHHEGKALDDDAAAVTLVAQVRASAIRATAASLDQLARALRQPIESISLRAWPLDFPQDIAVQRRVPYEARADSVMYRQVLADVARERGWGVHLYEAKEVEAHATSALGKRAHEVLFGPRATLGPPWAKDHRIALAATIMAG